LNGFSSNPESASFIPEDGAPAADSNHRAVHSPADGDGSGSGNQKNSRFEANGADVGNECIGFHEYLGFWKKGREGIFEELNTFGAPGTGESAANNIGDGIQLPDARCDISTGFLFARGYPVGGACFSAADNFAAFIFKDKGGLGTTAIDTEIDH
jgi:hypothetical protein